MERFSLAIRNANSWSVEGARPLPKPSATMAQQQQPPPQRTAGEHEGISSAPIALHLRAGGQRKRVPCDTHNNVLVTKTSFSSWGSTTCEFVTVCVPYDTSRSEYSSSAQLLHCRTECYAKSSHDTAGVHSQHDECMTNSFLGDLQQ